MNTLNLFITAALLLASPAGAQRGGREPLPAEAPKPPATSTRGAAAAPGSKRSGRTRVKAGDKPMRPKPAALSIAVTPNDSTINLGGKEYRAVNGTFVHSELTPGTYRLVISRDGYQSEGYEIELRPGHYKPLSVSLRPLRGILSVAPLVAETEISIVELATGRRSDYAGRARDVELPPGRYKVSVSKEGYSTDEREVLVEPTRPVFLTPSLARLPKPPSAPRRAAPPFSPDRATQAQLARDGKYVVVTLTGRSGDALNGLGAVDVTLSVGGNYAHTVNLSGMLTGYPCQVDFVRLENVAEYSFVEPPGAANRWARAVVRVRPKESKRPVRFLINWKLLRGVMPEGPPVN